ncbi:alpha/beta fold hydrolase [Aeromicrobium wangtongii]|uniref:Alpha/beta fold hydrolase n=1 Tax=Aeromicrobium wangtongii TaxID=2969247 RepID=A0ABY5MC59_9ACTN|nr:alpha/beta fold hydrolase [Aeromicrobium wangtongii]MCD9197003.1 alpha/beta fold hydrolase [Aeromicrobium wangtongii]UUP14504.1 alpha/beta fold hydrolase [Aeromicrobium wangtongii]
MSRSGELFASLPSGIDLCYETFGDPDDPAILLIMGLGGPMGWWTPEFCEQLAGRGFFVIRYDNRDTGRSTKLRQHPVSRVDVVRAFTGLPVLGRVTPPYTLSDLAGDALGLLDHLGIERAHLVGISMGGMIAQTIAIEHPSRALSLTSIMSTTGRRTVGFQHPKVYPVMLSPAGRTRESYVERSLKGSKVIGSPAFPTDEESARARAFETYDRGWTASGVTRQMLAILTQPDRTEALRRLELPALVIHGLSDVLVHRSGGKATADAIPGAEHLEIAGMAHDLPVQLYSTVIDAIVRTTERVHGGATR